MANSFWEEYTKELREGKIGVKTAYERYRTLVRRANARSVKLVNAGIIISTQETFLFRTETLFSGEKWKIERGLNAKQLADRIEYLNEFLEDDLTKISVYNREKEDIRQKFSVYEDRTGKNTTDLYKNDAFIEFILRGGLSELIKNYGNSDDVLEDIEANLTENTTYEDLKEAFDKYNRGGAYNDALRMLRRLSNGRDS